MKYLLILICVCVFPAVAVACDCCETTKALSVQVPTTVYDEFKIQIPRTVMVDQEFRIESTTADEGGRDLRRGERRRLERRLDRNERMAGDNSDRTAELKSRLGIATAKVVIGRRVCD